MEDVKNKTSISVIISAYQADCYIEECINSVSNQLHFKDFDDYEILIGLDGCENTLNKILTIEHKFKNLKIVWFPKNVGPYLVFNTLINISSFPVISIFGADDVMRENFVNDNLILLKKGTCVVARGQNFINPNKKKIVREYNPDGILIFYKDDFLSINGFENWRCGADSDLKVRFILNKIKIIKSESATFLRRIHENSLTSRNNKYGFGSKYRKNIQRIVRSREEAKIASYKTFKKYKIIVDNES